MRQHGNLGAAARIAGAALDFQQALLDFRHFVAEQFDHELGRRARQDDGRAAQRQVNVHDHGAHAVTAAQVFLGHHVAAAQAPFDATGLDNEVALVHALDGASEDFFTARHEVVQQHFALCIADLLQDDLLGRHGANAPDGHGLDGFLDVFTDFHVIDALFGVHQQLFGLRVLQPGVVRHHQPAAEGFVISAVPVDGHANVDLALVQLFGGLRQSQFHRAQHHVALDVLLARNGINQHQQFAIHATTLLFFTWRQRLASQPCTFNCLQPLNRTRVRTLPLTRARTLPFGP